MQSSQPTASRRPAIAPRPPTPATPRSLYLRLLTWTFMLFSSVRMLAYLPTIWAIHATGDTTQHSLWTWITWTGANATMAAWLHEQNGQPAAPSNP